jgi:hypothetical protein
MLKGEQIMKRFPKVLLVAGLLVTLSACDYDANPFGVSSQSGDLA